ncbi:FecR family protein [Ensifer soli]|uniref:FecR family protein n=1 Tax=Ciceribacter sp. sgz301302 TaxID=3342379 RepID=UPI0035BA5C20
MDGAILDVRRRRFLMGAAVATVGAIGLRAPPAFTAEIVGTANAVRGTALRRRDGREEGLRAGSSVLDRDTVATGEESFADLMLGGDTRILLGSLTELLIDRFIAGQGGTLELGGGQMVFDRPEGLPKVDLAVRTTFGMIGVRGTKFFCGPSRGVFAVFVEHGRVSVEGGGATRMVGAGEGVDIAAPGSVPTVPARWGEARIREAYASAGLPG